MFVGKWWNESGALPIHLPQPASPPSLKERNITKNTSSSIESCNRTLGVHWLFCSMWAVYGAAGGKGLWVFHKAVMMVEEECLAFSNRKLGCMGIHGHQLLKGGKDMEVISASMHRDMGFCCSSYVFLRDCSSLLQYRWIPCLPSK